jgi:hypothetical protein
VGFGLVIPYMHSQELKGLPENHSQDGIEKTLKDIGVTYVHRNEDLIADNVIQRQRVKRIISEVIRVVAM